MNGLSSPLVRPLRRVGLVLAVAVIAVGAVVAIQGEMDGGVGPAGVVARYFAALRRGDAAAALSYGSIPSGSRALLTDTALRAQQHDAPVGDVVVLNTSVSGPRATVQLGYQLGFADGAVTVATSVALHRLSGGWRLHAVAIPTRFVFSAAAQRASIAGIRVPSGRALLFPGAVALRFDTPYLSGSDGNGVLSFGAPTMTVVDVRLTPAGRRAAAADVRASLAQCLRLGGDVSCPQPDERVVPGTMRGTVNGGLRDLTISLDASPIGLAVVRAQAAARVSYQRLDFTDVAIAHAGTVLLNVRADVLVGPGASVRWTA